MSKLAQSVATQVGELTKRRRKGKPMDGDEQGPVDQQVHASETHVPDVNETVVEETPVLPTATAEQEQPVATAAAAKTTATKSKGAAKTAKAKTVKAAKAPKVAKQKAASKHKMRVVRSATDTAAATPAEPVAMPTKIETMRLAQGGVHTEGANVMVIAFSGGWSSRMAFSDGKERDLVCSWLRKRLGAERAGK